MARYYIVINDVVTGPPGVPIESDSYDVIMSVWGALLDKVGALAVIPRSHRFFMLFDRTKSDVHPISKVEIDNTMMPGGAEDPVTHNTIMDAGKHKGKRFADISGGYWLWLRDQEWFKSKPENGRILEYIKENEQDFLVEQAEEKRKRGL